MQKNWSMTKIIFYKYAIKTWNEQFNNNKLINKGKENAKQLKLYH